MVLGCLWGLCCFSSNAPCLWSGRVYVWGGVAGASRQRVTCSGLCDGIWSCCGQTYPGNPPVCCLSVAISKLLGHVLLSHREALQMGPLKMLPENQPAACWIMFLGSAELTGNPLFPSLHRHRKDLASCALSGLAV